MILALITYPRTANSFGTQTRVGVKILSSKGPYLFVKVFLTIAFLLPCLSAEAQKKQIKISDCSQTIAKIYRDFKKNNIATDSTSHKLQMEKCLGTLCDKCEPEDLRLLINIWMYYTPKDLPIRDLVEPVLFENRSAAIEAINWRMDHKLKAENNHTEPFSLLFDLSLRLVK